MSSSISSSSVSSIAMEFPLVFCTHENTLRSSFIQTWTLKGSCHELHHTASEWCETRSDKIEHLRDKLRKSVRDFEEVSIPSFNYLSSEANTALTALAQGASIVPAFYRVPGQGLRSPCRNGAQACRRSDPRPSGHRQDQVPLDTLPNFLVRQL